MATISVFAILRSMYMDSFKVTLSDGTVLYATNGYNRTAFFVAAVKNTFSVETFNKVLILPTMEDIKKTYNVIKNDL